MSPMDENTKPLIKTHGARVSAITAEVAKTMDSMDLGPGAAEFMDDLVSFLRDADHGLSTKQAMILMYSYIVSALLANGENPEDVASILVKLMAQHTYGLQEFARLSAKLEAGETVGEA